MIVVDDNAVLRRTLVRLIGSMAGLEVVGEATSGSSALEEVDRLAPDLVLMDLVMPGMDGLEATRRLASRSHSPAVVVMSVHDLSQYREAARAMGARAFISKDHLRDQLVAAIEGLRSSPGAAGPSPAFASSSPPGRSQC